ncbi:hypothetical protein FP435_00480 (plasmid) [Lactobacillus sp. PV037]|uniref:hypothetical protein n=1 Tax=unclassified Lactobacillus TaxID=2620435 RepID=UPI00223EEE7D|nr:MULTISPECIES: hypothetical protein [unclassified Lactobacillus]QNQ82912.1 hypothetical protein FP433_07375 [Lactobacillus sp. PV012]QNQ83017.1 hypothetical protein FP435_00480 [Lactobacillus sp. PV037]
MTKDYDRVEQNVALSINKLKGSSLPNNLPQWLVNLGVRPGAIILKAEDIGASSPDNKTDILVTLKNSEPLKISVKKPNADYYGNWYGHIKMVNVFGKQIFDKLTVAITQWANNIKDDPTWDKKPFVGVSVNFGKRSGKTKLGFNEVFSNEDILTIAKGKGNGTNTANTLLITDHGAIDSADELISSLEELTVKNILNEIGEFDIAVRPINPMTEGSNRGKNIYTRFVPYKKLDVPTTITTMSELTKLGTYKTVSPVLSRPMLTHNFVLDDLEKNYNIIIPRKSK